MIINLFYIVCALIGLGFLIFIHELGHYFMARHVGMKVEVFSIGFGRPFRVWQWQGVRWQFCILPFGGYVKIAGMEKKGSLEPHQIPEGFFGKKPIDRIKVAIMGPLVNLLFALLMFAVIWVAGGRVKPFSGNTKIVGWVEPYSKSYKEGITPGDRLEKVDNKTINNFNDLLYAFLFNGDQMVVEGEKIDYWTGEKRPFHFTVEKDSKQSIEQQITEIMAIMPASFLYYTKEKSVKPGSPMEQSGIRFGDRVVWVDGEIVFSMPQLSRIVNQPRVLLTVQRGAETLLARVPRLNVSDLKLSDVQKAEIDDWRSEAKLSSKLPHLYFIPYNLTNGAIVDQPLTYINEQSEHCSSFDPLFQGSCSPLEKPLIAGDKIIAVDGRQVENSFDLLAKLQERKILIAVLSDPKTELISWKQGDHLFVDEIHWNVLAQMVGSIGTATFIPQEGNLRFLNPVTPITVNDFPESSVKNNWLQKQSETREEIENIKDPEQRERAKKEFEDQQKRLILGIELFDEQVRYNPSPFVLFGESVEQTWRTIQALFTGHLTPKAMAGPVGIIQVMHYSWTKGIKEVFFWLGFISLNLGILNLLPIPVMDGGHICFSLWEAITKKPIKAKTMERLTIPFIILLVALFLFLTYNDIARLLKGFF